VRVARARRAIPPSVLATAPQALGLMIDAHTLELGYIGTFLSYAMCA
jgi:hypothetical protein